MSTLVAYIAIFIGAGIFGIAERGAAEPAPDPVAEHGRRHPAGDRARLRPAGPRADGPAAAPGRRTGAVPQQLDPALRAGRGDDGRRARGLPDRRGQGRRRPRRDDAAHRRSRSSTCSGRCSAATRPTRSSTGTPFPGIAAAAPVRHRAARDHRDHGHRLPRADLRHHRPDLQPVVHLHRHRGLARGRRGGHQARHPPSGQSWVRRRGPTPHPSAEPRRPDVVQPAPPQLPQGA